MNKYNDVRMGKGHEKSRYSVHISCLFKTESHSAAQADLELIVFISKKRWEYVERKTPNISLHTRTCKHTHTHTQRKKLGVVENACTPITWEGAVGGSGVLGQPQPYNKFEGSLCHVRFFI